MGWEPWNWPWGHGNIPFVFGDKNKRLPARFTSMNKVQRNRGKNTHSRYVANTFLFPSPRPSLHVLPFIHEIPANYDKSITDSRRHFTQVIRLMFFFFFIIFFSDTVCSPAHQSLNEQGNRHADPIQSKDYYIP
jgi:hypothetical protein